MHDNQYTQVCEFCKKEFKPKLDKNGYPRVSKCGTCHDKAPELEHIIPLSRGGLHTFSNVACSCRKCNHAKGDKEYGQLNLGFSC